MEALSAVHCFTAHTHLPSSRATSIHRLQGVMAARKTTASVIRTSSRPVTEVVEEDIMQIFLRERQEKGDLISKASDVFWKRVSESNHSESGQDDFLQQVEEVPGNDVDEDGGFLKLTRTQEWLTGASSAPVNKKAIAKALQDDRERRKKLNLLRYEALKRELMFVSIGIGAACTGYCLVTLSVQAAVSYAVGVLFSLLYLQLLCQHTDNLSKEAVPKIFTEKKPKKIGIRSEDLKDFLEKSVKGSTISLSSPRLVIPAAIYGLWILSHRYLTSEFFDFQLVPAMVGMFVYKAAALVQVYRDNDDLQFVFPENGEGSSD